VEDKLDQKQLQTAIASCKNAPLQELLRRLRAVLSKKPDDRKQVGSLQGYCANFTSH
jgi:hypothetical protein